MNEFSDQVNLVISDNASTDETKQVILKHISANRQLQITHYQQTSNTGYFGNFSKCRELANGEYFWLLSDNDFVAHGVVSEIITSLKANKPSFVFIRDWVEYDRMRGKDNALSNDVLSIEKTLAEFNYKLTLTSSVIFLNNKSIDQTLNSIFKGNAFIGFAYFLLSLDRSKNVAVISGTGLITKYAEISFNVFYAFSVELRDCLKFAVQNKIISVEEEKAFMNRAIEDLTLHHYVLFRLTGKTYGNKYNDRSSIESLLSERLSEYDSFSIYLKVLFTRSNSRLKVDYYRKKIVKKIKKAFHLWVS